LINKKTGGKMQLDGYCPSLKIAFEYNGSQHYKTGFFSQLRTSNSVEHTIERDKQKVDLCKKKGIFLFVINYKDNLINLPKIIQKKSSKLGLDLSKVDFKKRINFSHIHQHNSKLIKMQKIARERGGKCLSDKYVNNITKLKWMCHKGHTWNAIPTHIVSSKSWCPVCQGRPANQPQKLTIEEMQKIARERGGKCLSKTYVNCATKLEWICSEGHKWKTRPDMLRRGSWCPVCAVKKITSHKLTIEEMKKIALKKKGNCLSTVYYDRTTKLMWECFYGHKWMATPANIKVGKSWCPVCKKI